MKKSHFILPLIFVSTTVFLVNCTKDKTIEPIPSTFITADCPDTIKFQEKILPIITEYCISCHESGQSPNFSNHETVVANVDKIFSSLTASNGVSLMPFGGPAINDSLIQQFKCWMSQGKLNN